MACCLKGACSNLHLFHKYYKHLGIVNIVMTDSLPCNTSALCAAAICRSQLCNITFWFLLFMGLQTNSHFKNEERKHSSQIQKDVCTILYTVYILDCLQRLPLTPKSNLPHAFPSRGRLFSFPMETGLLRFVYLVVNIFIQGLGSCHFCFLGALGRQVRMFRLF